MTSSGLEAENRGDTRPRLTRFALPDIIEHQASTANRQPGITTDDVELCMTVPSSCASQRLISAVHRHRGASKPDPRTLSNAKPGYGALRRSSPGRRTIDYRLTDATAKQSSPGGPNTRTAPRFWTIKPLVDARSAGRNCRVRPAQAWVRSLTRPIDHRQELPPADFRRKASPADLGRARARNEDLVAGLARGDLSPQSLVLNTTQATHGVIIAGLARARPPSVQTVMDLNDFEAPVLNSASREPACCGASADRWHTASRRHVGLRAGDQAGSDLCAHCRCSQTLRHCDRAHHPCAKQVRFPRLAAALVVPFAPSRDHDIGRRRPRQPGGLQQESAWGLLAGDWGLSQGGY